MRIFVSGANMKDNTVSFISSYLEFNMAAVIDDVATTKPIMADFSKIPG